jgi:hypothetical protein
VSLHRLLLVLVLGLACAVPSVAGAQDDPHAAGVPGAMPGVRQVVTARGSMQVPPGTIRVTIVDQAGAPLSGAEVKLSVMGAGAGDHRPQRTDAAGTTTFARLATGPGESYVVKHTFGGASYGSEPFMLPPAAGYDVRITRLPTTRDLSTVLLAHGELAVEFREGRMHLSQSMQLMNLGQSMYVFPEGGILIELPRGFTAPQTETLMTDQRLLGDDRGYRLHGSLPPGTVDLSWAYQLPLEGAQQEFELPVPFRTYSYRVITEAPDGATLDVEAVTSGQAAGGVAPSTFTHPQVVENEGRRLFLSDLERTSADPALASVRVSFSGLPTPGPLRWFAAIGALLLSLVGAYLAFASGAVQSGDALATRKAQVLDALAALERQRKSEEIGPRTYEQERERLMIDLAAVIRAEERRPADGKRKSAPAASAGVSSGKGPASR